MLKDKILKENDASTERKKTSLPQLTNLSNGIKDDAGSKVPPALPIKTRNVISSSVPTRPNRLSTLETPTASTSKLSMQTLRKIERHQSSDAILTSPTSAFPPVNKRRHSSQERLGRFNVQTSNVKSNGTSQASAPVPLPPRPKVSATEKPKFRYTRSISGPILTGSRRDSEQIVIEQVCLVNNNNNNNINDKTLKLRTTENGTTRQSSTKSTTKVILNRSKPIFRASSYTSGSSNSSVSSQATEEMSLTESSSSTDSAFGKRVHHRTPILITHPRITADLPRRLYTRDHYCKNLFGT